MAKRIFRKRRCDVCGDEYTPTDPRGMYCGDECKAIGEARAQSALVGSNEKREKHYSTAGVIHEQYKLCSDKAKYSRYYFAFCDLTDREQRVVLRMADNIVFRVRRMSQLTALEVVAQLGVWHRDNVNISRAETQRR